MPFPTVKSADNADLNGAVTKLNLRNEINAYISRLCKNVIHLLKLGASSMVADRTSLVEKCLIFYNLLLHIKFVGNCMVTHLTMHCITLLFKDTNWCYKVATGHGSHKNLNRDPWLEPPVFYHSMTTITTSPQNSVHCTGVTIMPQLHTQHHYVIVMAGGCLVV